MPQAIVGAIAIVVGQYAGTAILVQLGAGLLLSYASKLFAGKRAPVVADTEPQLVTVSPNGPQARMIIYGQCRVSGASVFA